MCLLIESSCVSDEFVIPSVCEEASYLPHRRSRNADVALNVVLEGQPRALHGHAVAVILARRFGEPGFALHATAPDFDESLVADAGNPDVELSFEALITEIPLDLTLDVEIIDPAKAVLPVFFEVEVCVGEVSTRDTTIALTVEPRQ